MRTKSMTMKTRTKTRNNYSEIKKSLLWLLIPVSAVLLAVILNSFVILSAIVPSVSMADTLEKGSLLVADRLAYLKSSPQRGDVIIFTHPEIDERHIVKRVIAVAGDSVEIRQGRVYLNFSKEPLSEPYVNDYDSDSMESVTVPDGCLFVMGDNRQNSHDSRHLNDSFVRTEEVEAKAVLTLLPKVKKLK